MTDGNFRWNGSTTTAVLELRKKVLSILVHTVDVTINVDSVTVSPVLWLVDIEFIKALTDLLRVNFLRNVDHLCSILHQTAVLSFRRLVWTETSPLSWVKVTSFEVRLAADERRGYPAHVRE